MPFFSHGPSIPHGWTQAPGDVQAEIFLVWQEDELPDELKNAPGYVPFTLSPGAEAWVRGMAEIKEIDGPKEKIVIGRPRPAAPAQHRSLLPEPAPPPGLSTPVPAAPAWDPGIAAKEWIRRQAPRSAPAVALRIDSAPPPERPDERPKPHAPPAIGKSPPSEPVVPPRPAPAIRTVPQIGAAEEPPTAAEEGPSPPRETARRVPDIGPP